MDVKVIVKQMRDSGMSDEEIIANLKDLGVPNPESYLQEGPITPPKTQAPTAQSEEAMPLFESINKPKTNPQPPISPSVSSTEAKELFESPTTKPKPPVQSVEEETTPNLQFTRVEGDEEQTVDLEKILGKENQNSAAKVMTSMPKSNINSDEIESKLDETVALLKSLQEINKKILETNRDILMRLKTN